MAVKNNIEDEKQKLDTRRPSVDGCSGRPLLLRKFANLPTFTVFLSLFGIIYGMNLSYIISQLTTIQKRFGLTNTETGWMLGSYEIGYLMFIVLVGHFGSRAHRPKLIGAGLLMVASSCFLMCLPHFIYRSRIPALVNKTQTNLNHSDPRICDANMDAIRHCSNPTSIDTEVTEKNVAFLLFVISMIVTGIGPTAFWSCGMAYIDDNADPRSSSVHISVVMGGRNLAPAFGFLLGAFTASQPQDLKETDITPDHVNWIGAWWLGFIVDGILAIIIAIAIMLFPKRIKQSEDSPEKSKSNHSAVSRNLTKEFKGLLGSLWRLAKNPVYVCLNISGAFDIASAYGYLSYLPKYIENQFQTTAHVANIIVGSSVSLTAVLGLLFGGVVTAKIKLPFRKVLFLAWTLVVGTSFMWPLLIVIGCPNAEVYGYGEIKAGMSLNDINMTATCNSNCGCIPSLYEPVCSNGVTYHSACYAGCSGSNFTESRAIIYTNCSCTEDGLADDGFCSTTCKLLIPFIVLILVFTFFETASGVPFVMLSMRCVRQEDKNLGMAVISGLFSLACLPVPVIFGYFTDGSCAVPRPDDSCGQDRSTCLLYDKATFRFYLNIASFVIRIGAPLFKFIAWYLVRNMEFPEHDKALKKDIDLREDNDISLNDECTELRQDDYSDTSDVVI